MGNAPGAYPKGRPAATSPGLQMGSIKRVLSEVCHDLGKDQHTPNRKWIRDVLTGMIAGRSTMLSEIARHTKGEAGLFHKVKRLSRGLNSDRLNDAKLQAAHFERVSRFTRKNDGAGVVIGVDYTDISHKYARPERKKGMPSCICWNGSDGGTSMGIPVVQLEASLPDGNQLPVLLHPFLHKGKDAKHSQNLEFIDAIKLAAPFVGSQAFWCFDRGFDGSALIHGVDAATIRWIVRLNCGTQKQRELYMADGRRLIVNDAALETIPRFKLDIKNSRKKARNTGKKSTTLEIGFRKVFLSDQKTHSRATGPARTLIVVWGFGKTPQVLLVSEELTGKAAILEAAKAYGRRWKAEEATRSIKESRGWGLRLEDMRALTLRGIRRLALLGAVAYLVIALLQDLGGSTLARILSAVETLGKPPADIRYRIMRGLGMLLEGALSRRARTPADIL